MWRRVTVLIVATSMLVACASEDGAPNASSPPHGSAAPPVTFAGWELDAPGAVLAPDRPLEVEPLVPRRAARSRTITARARRPSLLTWWNPGPTASPMNRLATSNPFGQSMSFEVRGVRRDSEGNDWIRIRTGEYPNGAEAWVRGADVRLDSLNQRIVIDVSRRLLVRYLGGKVRARVRVAVGGAGTPTVPGRYFVWARVRYDRPGGAYGKLALGLSGFSEVVRFGLSPGRLAIHGTDDPTDRGKAVSLGCVRVYNGEIGQLWSVPMGTPVLIRP
jgi:lipoprotein-anchoring transpeptidase ErfK/SrfK